MPGIPVHCDSCGRSWISNAVSFAGRQHTLDIGVGCACGGVARTARGIYDFQEHGVSRFQASNPAELARFQTIAEALAAGAITPKQAAEEAAQLNTRYAAWLKLFQDFGGLPLLIALIALWLQVADSRSDEEASAAILAELTQGRAVSEQQLEATREVLAELKTAREEAARSETRSNAPRARSRTPSRPTAGTASNRHERRRAAKLAKKPSGSK